MANVHNYTGAVNINADITPITRQKIDQVTSSEWHLMDIDRLWDQRLILNERSMLASKAGHAEISKQIQAGINHIDMLLQIREAEKAEQIENPPRPGSLKPGGTRATPQPKGSAEC